METHGLEGGVTRDGCGLGFWVRRKSERKRKERERDGLASNSFELKSLKFELEGSSYNQR
jgi:hypothetical protein